MDQRHRKHPLLIGILYLCTGGKVKYQSLKKPVLSTVYRIPWYNVPGMQDSTACAMSSLAPFLRSSVNESLKVASGSNSEERVEFSMAYPSNVGCGLVVPTNKDMPLYLSTPYTRYELNSL